MAKPYWKEKLLTVECNGRTYEGIEYVWPSDRQIQLADKDNPKQRFLVPVFDSAKYAELGFSPIDMLRTAMRAYYWEVVRQNNPAPSMKTYREVCTYFEEVTKGQDLGDLHLYLFTIKGYEHLKGATAHKQKLIPITDFYSDLRLGAR